MVTTFVDEKEVSKTDLSTLYDCRWFVEIALKAIKETMGMDILRAKTPEMVRKEIWAHLLAYNLIRKIMAQAASRYDKNPRGLSFKCALQFIDAFRRSGNLSENSPAYEYLLKAIAYKAVGNRPGRSEPRMVKRRPKAFPRLQNPRSSYHKKVA
jgi:Transposase DDE domain